MIKLKNTPPYYENAPLASIKEYIALISQTGTNDPTVLVIKNTIGEITPSRTATGSYKLTSAGLFTANKTYTNITQTLNPVTEGSADITYSTVSQITIRTYNTSTGADSMLVNTPIYIQVLDEAPINTQTTTEPEIKKYVALLTQLTTNPPTATELENTLGGTPTYNYQDVGIYEIELTGAFPIDKTYYQILSNGGSSQNQRYVMYSDSPDKLIIESYYPDGSTKADDKMYKIPILITVYP